MEDVVNAGRMFSGRTHSKVLVLGPRRSLSATAAAMAVVMSFGLLSAPAAFAEPPNSGRPTVKDRQKPIEGRNLKARPRKPDPAAKPGPPAKVVWPAPGTAEVDVSAPASTARSTEDAGAKKAGELPIEVLPPHEPKQARASAQPAGRVRVQVLDRSTTRAMGIDGLAFTVARTDAATPGRVRVRLDYSKFGQAFGGSYGARLRLKRMPHCAMTTPPEPECRISAPLETVNDGENQTLTAEVEAAPSVKSGSPAAVSMLGGATLLVADADSGSSQGDYKATSLEPSATWQAGGSSGDFSWSY